MEVNTITRNEPRSKMVEAAKDLVALGEILDLPDSSATDMAEHACSIVSFPSKLSNRWFLGYEAGLAVEHAQRVIQALEQTEANSGEERTLKALMLVAIRNAAQRLDEANAAWE